MPQPRNAQRALVPTFAIAATVGFPQLCTMTPPLLLGGQIHGDGTTRSEEYDGRHNARPREIGSTKWEITFEGKKGQERKNVGREREGQKERSVHVYCCCAVVLFLYSIFVGSKIEFTETETDT